MTKESYYINEVAKAHGISKRTLDYYDKINLLKPDYVAENGYRIYNEDKFKILQGILSWKLVGLDSLDIKNILLDTSTENILATILSREEKIDQQITELLTTKSNLSYLKQRLLTRVISDQVQLSLAPEETVYCLSDSAADLQNERRINEIGARFFKLLNQEQQLIQENGFIFKQEDIENKEYTKISSCYITTSSQDQRDLIPYTISAGKHATLWYTGPFNEMHLGIQSLIDWLELYNLSLCSDVIVTEQFSSLYTLDNDIIAKITVLVN